MSEIDEIIQEWKQLKKQHEETPHDHPDAIPLDEHIDQFRATFFGQVIDALSEREAVIDGMEKYLIGIMNGSENLVIRLSHELALSKLRELKGER